MVSIDSPFNVRLKNQYRSKSMTPFMLLNPLLDEEQMLYLASDMIRFESPRILISEKSVGINVTHKYYHKFACIATVKVTHFYCRLDSTLIADDN